MSKSIDCVAKEIFDYMMDHNRPFNGHEILNNMEDSKGKANFTRGMDQLVKEKKVVEKSYGKQKIYYINQDLFADSGTNADTKVNEIDNEIRQLSSTLSLLNEQIKRSEEKIAEKKKTPTTEEAQTELVNVKDNICNLRAAVDRVGAKQIDPERRKNVIDSKNRYQKEYIQRKRMANTIVEAILENYPGGKKKQLLEDIGIEIVDEDSSL